MKPLLLIFSIVICTFAVAVGLMQALHLRLAPTLPITAASIAIISGTAGLLPLIRTEKTDPGSLLQLAMAGTILHLMMAAICSITAVAISSPELRTHLAFWLLGGYWLSLFVVIWQARLVIVKASARITDLASNQAKAH